VQVLLDAGAVVVGAMSTDTGGRAAPDDYLPASPPGAHDKAVELEQLELPVLGAMIYETFLLKWRPHLLWRRI
jgi:hypothetical protein